MSATMVHVARTRTPLDEGARRAAEVAMLREYRSRLAREIAEIDREIQALAS